MLMYCTGLESKYRVYKIPKFKESLEAWFQDGHTSWDIMLEVFDSMVVVSNRYIVVREWCIFIQIWLRYGQITKEKMINATALHQSNQNQITHEVYCCEGIGHGYQVIIWLEYFEAIYIAYTHIHWISVGLSINIAANCLPHKFQIKLNLPEVLCYMFCQQYIPQNQNIWYHWVLHVINTWPCSIKNSQLIKALNLLWKSNTLMHN